MKTEHLSQQENEYFAGYALRHAAIRLNARLFHIFHQMPIDNELTKAVLDLRSAIVATGGA